LKCYITQALERRAAESIKSFKKIRENRKKFLTKPSSCANITKLLTEKRVSKFGKKLQKNSKEFEKALDKPKTA